MQREGYTFAGQQRRKLAIHKVVKDDSLLKYPDPVNPSDILSVNNAYVNGSSAKGTIPDAERNIIADTVFFLAQLQ